MLPENRFHLAKNEMASLADQFGTPLFVLDEGSVRERTGRFKSALSARWPRTSLTYASKANGTLALLQVVADEGYGIDCAGAGELMAAIRAGIPAANCHLHGNAKSLEDLELALKFGVGNIVVDSMDEARWLSQSQSCRTPLVLRLNPGVTTSTHQKISTGHGRSKFGVPIHGGQAQAVVRHCLDSGLNLEGFHIHLGSQLRNPSELAAGAEAMIDFTLQMHRQYGLEIKIINLGGGIGVRQTLRDDPVDIEGFVDALLYPVRQRLTSASLEPTIAMEPGRAIIAEAGVTLYRVITRKDLQGGPILAVDGGMSDNPSPSLYRREFDVMSNREGSPTTPFTIFGAHCESDLLFNDAHLPSDSGPGDVLQVLCTGAYNASMASNYNRFRRPATIMRRSNGEFALVQERETWEELLEREILLDRPAQTPSERLQS